MGVITEIYVVDDDWRKRKRGYGNERYSADAEVPPKSVSRARITLDEPIIKNEIWSLNVFLPDYHLAVAWQTNKGFGIVSDDSHGYGEGADEVYEDLESALPRVNSSTSSSSQCHHQR